MDLSTVLELFGAALAALAALAVTAPLVGAFLHARGAALHGLLLPQVATFGVALGFALHPLLAGATDGHAHEPPAVVLLAWAGAATLLASLALAWLRAGDRAADADEGGRVAGAFALASAGTVLASQLAPTGGLHVEALLYGEALAVGPGEATRVVAVAALVALILWGVWRDLLLSGHDPDFARALGLRRAPREAAFAVATCALVAFGTLALGPMTLFALLVLPPLAAHRAAPSMAGFLVGSSLAGILGAGLGAWLAFAADLPLGASVAAAAGAVALLGRLAPRRGR